MNFTFGIITSGENDSMIHEIITSIESQHIPEYEIIIVGNCKISQNNCIVLPFDETIKRGWITKKKNIICKVAKYENIVLMHDYVKLNANWYSGFLKYGNNFEICVTKIENLDGTRFRDFLLLSNHVLKNPLGPKTLLPYDSVLTPQINRLVYVSGTYYVIKKSLYEKFPLNENLLHLQGEDVEYSQRLTDNNIIIKCNPESSVKLMKQKQKGAFEEPMTTNDLIFLKTIPEYEMSSIADRQRVVQKEWVFRTFGTFIR